VSAPNASQQFDAERIVEALEAVNGALLSPIIRKAADEFYYTALEVAEEYLKSNLSHNLTSHLQTLERGNQQMRKELWEVDKALRCQSLGFAQRIEAIHDLQRRLRDATLEIEQLRAAREVATGAEAGEA